MEYYKRHSPVTFSSPPAQTQVRKGWEVVLNCCNEGTGPFLIDLSHIAKWDVQGENLSQIRPAGINIPQHSGDCRFKDGILINLVKWNWAIIWCFSEDELNFSHEYAYTDVTEAYALFALIGKGAFSIMEKVTNLDLTSPHKKTPFLLLGPILHIRSQVVVLEKVKDEHVVLIACPRGYGQSMAQALLEEGDEYGLRPGGENAFTKWLKIASADLLKNGNYSGR
jgi:glycine cleavage system aminomethyltransferase T